MSIVIAKFIRIETASTEHNHSGWKTIPGCERVPVWNLTVVDAVDAKAEDVGKRFIFQIAHQPEVQRNCKVTYLGQQLRVVSVSGNNRLRGMELRCEAIGAEADLQRSASA